MALDLPNSPTTGQTFSDGTRTWQYDGAKWNLIRSSGVTTTIGDIIYADTASSTARRGIGTTGQVLTVAGGVPVWDDKPWNVPWGVVGITNDTTTTQVIGTTPVAATGFSVDVTVVANRLYRVSSVGLGASSVAGITLYWMFQVGGVSIHGTFGVLFSNASGGWTVVEHNAIAAGLSAGVKTFRVWAYTSTGTVSMSGTNGTCRIVVEDIGPNGAPA